MKFSTDWTLPSVSEVLKTLIATYTPIKEVSPEYAAKLWEVNAHHAAKLGPTLRVEVAAPALSPSDLLQAYHEAFDQQIGYAPPLTTDDVVTQRVAAAKGQKLTRYLAGWIKQRDPEYYNNDRVSKMIDSLQAHVKAKNGLHLVLSANPLDKILASNFADYQGTTCHRWFSNNDGVGQYCVGNFAAASSPDVLVLYSYSTAVTYADITLPRKVHRQFIYPHGNEWAVMSRKYGRLPNELAAEQCRKMVAQYLSSSPDTGDLKWFRHDPPSNTMAASVTGANFAYHGDAIDCVIRIGENRERRIYPSLPHALYRDADNGEQTELKAPHCPGCACSRTDNRVGSFGCAKCCPNIVNCYNCSRTCVEGEFAFGSRNYCRRCFSERFFTCEGCNVVVQRQYAASVVNEDNETITVCRNCLTGYGYCTSCNNFRPASRTAHLGLCQTHAEQLRSDNTTSIDPSELDANSLYVTRGGRIIRLVRLENPSLGFYLLGIDPINDRTIATYSLSGTYFDPLLQMGHELDIIARYTEPVAEPVAV